MEKEVQASDYQGLTEENKMARARRGRSAPRSMRNRTATRQAMGETDKNQKEKSIKRQYKFDMDVKTFRRYDKWVNTLTSKQKRAENKRQTKLRKASYKKYERMIGGH